MSQECGAVRGGGAAGLVKLDLGSFTVSPTQHRCKTLQ